MSEFLFERPVELALALGIVWLSVLALWMLTRSKIWKPVMIGWGAVCLLLPLVSTFVTTEKEQVQKVMTSMMHDIKARRLNAMIPYLDKSYNYRDVSFAQLKNKLVRSGRSWKFRELKAKVHRIKRLSNGDLRVYMTCSGIAAKGSNIVPFDETFWKLRFHKKASSTYGWVITRLIPVKVDIPNQPTPDNLKGIMHMRI